eukprot:TRINITY_DN2109_c0_g1_i1.p1 TRINITY_DN2109_c0_g1~~TRINITY_DN2109_c0_g1_i1.p1  ORF type:complete len:161 (-),score=28.88 TRINITY_DN2109_c0_g1_i1:844-1326(-)
MGISALSDLASGRFLVAVVVSIIAVKELLRSALTNIGILSRESQEGFLDGIDGEPLAPLADGFVQLLAVEKAMKGNPSSVFCGSYGERYSDCAVCMSALEQGQKIRCLRACDHLFHESCIDQWIHYSSLCPLCRSPLLGTASEDQQKNHLSAELMFWFSH